MKRSDRDFLLYDRASRSVPADEDHRQREIAVIDEIARIMPFDVNDERKRAAKALVNRLTKTDGMDASEDEGAQLTLMIDGKRIDYDPRRLIRDGMGNLVEEQFAKPDALRAELERTSINVGRVNESHQRRLTKLAHFERWSAAQIAAGRNEREIVFGNCVAETGILTKDDAA